MLKKIIVKLKFYFSLNHEFELLRKDIKLLTNQQNSPLFLKFMSQDRFRLMEKLKKTRKTKDYEKAFYDKNPLVSVRIATYNNSTELLERAIPSVLKQTYKNWEIVIVGDYCSDDTQEKILKLNHPRIRFEQLTYHYPYPENQMQRWMAQGALVHNRAAELCNGDWIVPLDDDNEFLPNHIELLLKKAQTNNLELVYGNMISINRESGKSSRVGSFPPQLGTFDFSACLYHKSLKIFPYDINSFYLNEVIDTNLIRRLSEAEVRMGFINRYVTKYYFRKPGSIRSKEIYPQQPNVFSIYKNLNLNHSDLNYNLSDQIYDAISDSHGKVLIVGKKNRNLNKFTKQVCKYFKINLSEKKLDSKFNKEKNIEVLILNTNHNNNSDIINKIKNNLVPSALIIFLKAPNKNKLKLDENNYQYLEPNIVNKT